MQNKIIINEKQKNIINKLGDSLYTVDFLEEWINRNDDISVNAFAALQAMGAKGFYKAVLALEKQHGVTIKAKEVIYNIKDREIQSFKCGNCNYTLELGDKYCKKCSLEIDWNWN